MSSARIITSADALISAMRERKDELALSHAALEDIAGFCNGTIAKYLGPHPEKLKSPTVATLFLMLQAMGVGVVLVEDREQVNRVLTRWERKDERRSRPKEAA